MPEFNDLIRKMTLKEKLAQMTQLNGYFFDSVGRSVITGPMHELGIDDETILNAGSVLGTTGAATVELTAYDTTSLTFRLTGSHGVVVLDCNRDLRPSPHYTSCEKNGHIIIKLPEKTNSMRKITIDLVSYDNQTPF